LSEWSPEDIEVREEITRCVNEKELPLRSTATRAVVTVERWTKSGLDRIRARLIDDGSWMSKIILRLDPA
jgi:hypothetical protein